jgi:hypothetical protein
MWEKNMRDSNVNEELSRCGLGGGPKFVEVLRLRLLGFIRVSLLASLLWMINAPVHAQGYSLQIMADTVGAGGPALRVSEIYSSFGSGPGINNNGIIVFSAGPRSVAAGGRVFTSDGANLTLRWTGAVAGGPPSHSEVYYAPSINDAGTIGFGANSATGRPALLVAPNGTVTAHSGAGVIAVGNINSAGQIGWVRGFGQAPDEVWRGGADGAAVRVYGPGSSSPGVTMNNNNPALNDSGFVAFAGRYSAQTPINSEYQGVFVTDGVTFRRIFGTGDVPAGERPQYGALLNSGLSINNSGQVTFTAGGDQNVALSATGIYRGDGLERLTLVSAGGQFSGLGRHAPINDNGTIAFLAALTSGGGGLFTRSPDGTIREVFRYGTIVGGIRADYIFLGGINSSGQVSFSIAERTLDFANPARVVALRATPLPPPNPVPAISQLTPSTVTAGGPTFTLVVDGASFVAGAAVHWNGAARPTSLISATRISAQIPTSDIGIPGTANVTVVNPPSTGGGGGGSNALPITIAAPTSGTPQLKLTGVTSLTRSNGIISATLIISNTGTGPAVNVRVAGSSLGTAETTTTPLPVIGTISAGATMRINLDYPESAGNPGTTPFLRVIGAYSGGTFSVSRRVALP